MKKNSFILLPLALLFSSLTIIAQDTETRSLDDFDQIRVTAGIKANLVKGSKNEIRITAEGIELEKIKTEIKNDRLTVGIDQKWWKSMSWNKKKKVSATITYSSQLEGIAASSGAYVTSENVVFTDDLDLESSSGATLKLEVEASDVSGEVSSGATLSVSGSTTELDIDASSGASFKGYDLKSSDVTVDVSSGASAKVWAEASLNVDASSGGSVKYKGSPSSTDFDKSSGGSVRKASNVN